MKIHFLDTSVFCNILQVPFMCDQYDQTMNELTEICKNYKYERIILPFATIIETGNHIAQIKSQDNDIRYKTAQKFCEAINKTIKDEAPWEYYGTQLTTEDLTEMCIHFPESASQKTGFGDLSIIRAYETYKRDTSNVNEIRIWSYDSHLSQYHDVLDQPATRNKRH